MTPYNGDLIVAGRFDFAGSTQSTNIARWDGSQWYPMGDGLPTMFVHFMWIHSAMSCMQEEVLLIPDQLN
ncbi:MAG: hypothetical protein IPG39_16260 [Bacteroidetes bacterium]|nr:hypothetical protein [Bacteroidota bacterium]